MNSDTPKGGIAMATPHSPPATPEMSQTESVPTPAPAAPYPASPYPYTPAPYRYPPVQRPRERGGAHVAAWVIGGLLGFVMLAGLVVALLAAVVGGHLVSTMGQHELSATATKTFTVSGTPSLVISDTAGNVIIQQGGGSQVAVQLTKHAWGSGDAVAQGGLNHIIVVATQNGNTITVNTQFNASYFDGGPARRTLDVLVTVPAQANADVHLGAGNLQADQFTGAIRLDDGAGNVAADNVIVAGTSRLNTGAGNITVDGAIASGAAVDVHVGAGNTTLTLPSDTPAYLNASTGVGNLTIVGWQIPVSGTGFADRQASGDLGASPTGTLTVQVGTGNVTLMSR
jgi:hypothetical protein